MNTDTRHVWDFTGGGYVHRLVMQQEDVTNNEYNNNTIDSNNNRSSGESKLSRKIIEVRLIFIP